jgi:hypothetical protein
MALYRKPFESVVASLPAPTGGWNARDNIADMDERDAVQMENWFPGTTSVSMRFGNAQHVTGVMGQVESLMVWNGPSSSKMFGAATDSIYDFSIAGAVGTAEVTGLSGARLQYINVSTTAGNYLMAVNGMDKSAIYNGSWHRDGDGAPYDISGVDSATCIALNLHKNRVWLIQERSLDAWYLPTSAIGGTATKFSLNGVAMLGGSLVAMATWTMDAGYGMDDMAVFITSEGEVIVYSGTDPASAATWQLIGVYRIGPPVGGPRCWIKFSGDLLIITRDGVQPMSGALQSSRVNPRVSLTDKIQSAVSNAVSIYGSNFGWELTHFEEQNQLYLNVPVSPGNQQQYVMNTITKAWCNFTGWDANCFAIFEDELYFGGNGVVYQAWETQQDSGVDITGTTLQAFNYFRNRSQQKQFTMIRPVFQTNGSPDVFGGMNVDYDTSDTSATLTAIMPGGAIWDTAVWDAAAWAPDTSPVLTWQGAQGVGYCGAPRIKATVGEGVRLQWAASDVVFRKGGIL